MDLGKSFSGWIRNTKTVLSVVFLLVAFTSPRIHELKNQDNTTSIIAFDAEGINNATMQTKTAKKNIKS